MYQKIKLMQYINFKSFFLQQFIKSLFLYRIHLLYFPLANSIAADPMQLFTYLAAIEYINIDWSLRSGIGKDVWNSFCRDYIEN